MVARAIRDEDAPSYDGKAQLEKRHYTTIDDEVVDTIAATCGMAAFGLYAYLERRVDVSGRWVMTVAELADALHSTPRHVQDAIAKLTAGGWVVREERTNRFGMTKANGWYLPFHQKPRTDRGEVQYEVRGEVTPPSELHPLVSSYVVDTSKETPPLPPRGEPAKNERGSRIPDDFTVTDELRAWAVAKLIPLAVIESQTEAFVTYWSGESGTKARKANWGKTWQTWMLRWLERYPQKPIDRSEWPLPEPFRLRWQMFQDERTGMGHPPAAQYPATLQADIDHWRATGEVRMLRPIRAVAS